MIRVNDVHKRFPTRHGWHWVLRGIDLEIPKNCNVGLIGINGAGKSTLLRLIGGIDQPDRGEISRDCKVSWPLALSGGFQRTLSGRQNAKFVCRIQGEEEHLDDRLQFVQKFSELGEYFDEPVNTYSNGMRARLAFALSLAFDFDVYLVDEITAVGDAVFKQKTRKSFRELADRAGLIMTAHNSATLKDFCNSGVWLDNGQAHWFDSIDDALKAYSDSIEK
jgi:capsular polysaccharide transport system ATP-binding protein